MHNHVGDWPDEGHFGAEGNHVVAVVEEEEEEDADVRRLDDVPRRSLHGGFASTAYSAIWRIRLWEVGPQTFDAAAEHLAVVVGIAA